MNGALRARRESVRCINDSRLKRMEGFSRAKQWHIQLVDRVSLCNNMRSLDASRLIATATAVIELE